MTAAEHAADHRSRWIEGLLPTERERLQLEALEQWLAKRGLLREQRAAAGRLGGVASGRVRRLLSDVA